VNLQQYFSALESIGTVRIYLIKFNIHDNFIGIQNKGYRVQQKVKKQQCTLMVILQK